MKTVLLNIRDVVLLTTVLLFLAACSTTPKPETLNQRVAAAEIAYSEVLKTVIRYRDEGRFTDDQYATIQERVRQLQPVRNALYGALEAGNVDTAQDKLMVMNQILSTVRAILATEVD